MHSEKIISEATKSLTHLRTLLSPHSVFCAPFPLSSLPSGGPGYQRQLKAIVEQGMARVSRTVSLEGPFRHVQDGSIGTGGGSEDRSTALPHGIEWRRIFGGYPIRPWSKQEVGEI